MYPLNAFQLSLLYNEMWYCRQYQKQWKIAVDCRGLYYGSFLVTVALVKDPQCQSKPFSAEVDYQGQTTTAEVSKYILDIIWKTWLIWVSKS